MRLSCQKKAGHFIGRLFSVFKMCTRLKSDVALTPDRRASAVELNGRSSMCVKIRLRLAREHHLDNQTPIARGKRSQLLANHIDHVIIAQAIASTASVRMENHVGKASPFCMQKRCDDTGFEFDRRQPRGGPPRSAPHIQLVWARLALACQKLAPFAQSGRRLPCRRSGAAVLASSADRRGASIAGILLPCRGQPPWAITGSRNAADGTAIRSPRRQ